MTQLLHFSKRYLWPYKWWYLSGMFFVMLTQGIAVGIIEQTRIAIDAFSGDQPDLNRVVFSAFVLVALGVGLFFIRVVSRLLVFTPGRLIEYNIRNDYYRCLMFHGRKFYSQHESGDLVSRCSNDIGFVRGAYGYAMLQVANVLFTFLFGIAAMIRMDPMTTLYVAIPMAVSFVIIQVSIFFMFHYWRLSNEQVGALSSMALAAYRGVSAVQGFHAEPAFQARFERLNQAYLNTGARITTVRSFMMPLVQLVGNISIFVVLWFSGREVIKGNMTLGEITAFLGYIAMVMPPLLSLGWMLNVLFRAIPAVQRLDEVLMAPLAGSSIKDPQDPGPPDRNTNIIINQLSHTWASEKEGLNPFCLKDIDLTLNQGTTLGVVGPLGSGKTTFVESLLRLNHLNPGHVTLRGVDASQIPLDSYRRYFSFAPQKPFLFSTTLRENLKVALDPPKDSPKDSPRDLARAVSSQSGQEQDQILMQALDLAGFDLDPNQFPAGLDTEVGEKGIMLSGGQRQRIALARAFLKDADVFILDDVLSAVDHNTEQRIIGNLKSFAKGRTVIVLSHRISAVQWTDQIMVLEQGTMTDLGTHQELIARDGYYRDVYQSQLDGNHE